MILDSNKPLRNGITVGLLLFFFVGSWIIFKQQEDSAKHAAYSKSIYGVVSGKAILAEHHNIRVIYYKTFEATYDSSRYLILPSDTLVVYVHVEIGDTLKKDPNDSILYFFNNHRKYSYNLVTGNSPYLKSH